MKFRGLLASVVVLAALGGVLYWSQHHVPANNPDKNAEPEVPPIVHVNGANVTEMTLAQKGSAPVTLVANQPGQWQITMPIQWLADQPTISGILNDLTHFRAQRIIADHATDLAQYGLAEPALTFDITEKGNKATRLIIGNRTPTGEGAYAMVASDAHVYTIPYFLFTSFTKPLDELRDKRLLPFNVAAVTGLRLARRDETVVIDRKGTGWQIEKPAVYRTKTTSVDSLVRNLINAKFDPSVTPAQADAAWAKATPVVNIGVTASAGDKTETDTLDVRQGAGDEYYGKAGAFPGVWKLDASIKNAVSQKLDDLRNKQLLDLGFNEPLNIIYHAPTTNLTLVRSNQDWYQDGKKMDPTSVEGLINRLRSLTASGFVTSGFEKPDTDLTVVSQDGKLIEKVQFEHTKGGAIAKRDDGPSLYSLDFETISLLESAASAVKPVPAAPPAKK
jgi:Domain of unknown function (DUF4340)